MADLSDNGKGSQEMSSETISPETTQSNVKTCSYCGTTKTPLWRGGPAGPKSLCNACGIKSSKNRRGLLGLNKEDKKSVAIGHKNIELHHHLNQNCNSSSSSSTSTSTSGDSKSSNFVKNVVSSLKKNFLPFGREKVVLQRPRSSSTQKRKKLGEVEQAALLLMVISCGSVYYAQREMKMKKERKNEKCCTFGSKSSTLWVG